MNKVVNCERIMKWMTRILFVCCLILLVFFSIYIFSFHADHFREYCADILNINVNWSKLTAVSTLCAAIFALMAYFQSCKMSKLSSFNSVFAQILANFRSYLTDENVMRTQIIKLQDIHGKIRQTSTENESSYQSFCQKYIDRTGRKKQEVNDIRRIWTEYCMSLVYRANFLNTFKYIYYVVDLVVKSPLAEDDKRRYVKIVQAQLNMDVLFCYLINLICTYREKGNPYIDILKKYEFFKSLFDDGIWYRRIIEETIPYDVRQLYNSYNK